MKCSDIIKSLELLAPLECALGWDNCGLLVGDDEKEVKTVYVALDATDAIIKDAISKKADMIITHHPMIFGDIKRVVSSDFLGGRIISLIKNDISYYAMHTNYDVCGMGYEASDILGLSECETLEVTFTDDNGSEGIGKIGFLPQELTLNELSIAIKRRFNIECVKVFGDFEAMVHKVAICPGSGKSVIDEAIKKGADVLVTGDIDHHSGIDANMKGIHIIDAGHYGIEKLFVHSIYDYLNRNFSDLIIYCENLKEPFKYI